MLTMYMPNRLPRLLTLNSFNVVRREDAFPVAYPACPPIRFTLCTFDDGDDLALLESKIARLVCVKGELGNRLARSGTAAFEAEGGFGCAWSARSWALTVRVNIVALVAECGRAAATRF